MKYEPKTLLKGAFIATFQVGCQHFSGGICEIRSGYAILKALIFDIWLTKLIYMCYGT